MWDLVGFDTIRLITQLAISILHILEEYYNEAVAVEAIHAVLEQ
jgi:hypothetical protein